jgi:hypothetical protein
LIVEQKLYSLPKYLMLEVFDHDKLSSDESMGKARIPLQGLSAQKTCKWYKLTRHKEEGHKPLGWVMLELWLTSPDIFAEPLGSPVDWRLAAMGGEVKAYTGTQVQIPSTMYQIPSLKPPLLHAGAGDHALGRHLRATAP